MKEAWSTSCLPSGISHLFLKPSVTTHSLSNMPPPPHHKATLVPQDIKDLCNDGFFRKIYLFICLHCILVVAHEVFDIPCGMQDLISCPRIESGAPVLGAQSLSHWPTREVPVTMTLHVIEHLLHLTLLMSPCFWKHSREFPQGPCISWTCFIFFSPLYGSILRGLVLSSVFIYTFPWLNSPNFLDLTSR